MISGVRSTERGWCKVCVSEENTKQKKINIGGDVVAQSEPALISLKIRDVTTKSHPGILMNNTSLLN